MPREAAPSRGCLAPELLDHHLAQMRIGRDATTDAILLAPGGMQRVLGLLVLNVKDRGLKRSRKVGQMNRTPGLGLLLDVERHRRLEARKREAVVSPTIERTGEVNRAGIARLGQFGNDGAAGIAQTQRLSHFVKGFAHGVVERLAEHLVVAPRLDVNKHGMTARDEREDKRRFEIGLRQQVGEQMASR